MPFCIIGEIDLWIRQQILSEPDVKDPVQDLCLPLAAIDQDGLVIQLIVQSSGSIIESGKISSN